jgi:hypothetical protein
MTAFRCVIKGSVYYRIEENAMEKDWEPFEVVEEYGRTTLRLHGSESQRPKVEADRIHLIMDAVAACWDVDIECADIEGDLDIQTIDDNLERDENGRCVIVGNISVIRVIVSGGVGFSKTSFSGNVRFSLASFSGHAAFIETSFVLDVDFRNTGIIV